MEVSFVLFLGFIKVVFAVVFLTCFIIPMHKPYHLRVCPAKKNLRISFIQYVIVRKDGAPKTKQIELLGS